MKQSKYLLASAFTAFCFSASAQIFINTGNPNLDKYKSENPNAVIWEGGKNVPTPANTPNEPNQTPKKAVKEETPQVEKPAIKQEPVAVKKEQTVAQPADNQQMQYPPNAEPGKCYARCLAPDQYEIKEEQVIDKPATFRIDKTAAVYQTVYDTVIIKPAFQKTVTTPAQYDVITEDRLVTPATQKWVKGKADKNCLSSNPKDCEVWCLKEIPAVYEKATRKVETVPAVSKVVDIPALTKITPRKKLVEPSRENKVEIPATYKTIMKKVLVKKGGFQEWKEVVCEQDMTNNKIAQIQQALKREGYDPGPVDNEMGGKTKDALIKFQQDKGLPIGNLNMETLKSLGVQ